MMKADVENVAEQLSIWQQISNLFQIILFRDVSMGCPDGIENSHQWLFFQ